MSCSFTFAIVALVARITSLIEFFLTLLTNDSINKPLPVFLLSKKANVPPRICDSDLYIFQCFQLPTYQQYFQLHKFDHAFY